MMSRLKQSDGFTLIELMVIIVILGIFAAIAIPGFTSLINKNRIQSSANELQAMLQAARLDAVTKRSAVTVTQNADNSWTASQGGVTVSTVTVPDNIAVAPTVKTITFQPDGSATAGSIGVTNSEQNAQYTVSVTLPGLIKIVNTTPTSTDDGQ